MTKTLPGVTAAPRDYLAAPAKPTRAAVIEAHMACGFDRVTVEGYVDFWAGVVDTWRSNGHRRIHMTGRNFVTYHPILAATMSDDALPESGSPHDLLGRYLLEPTLGETRLIHTNSASPPLDVDCQVLVGVD